ncbi:MAG: sigma-54-dependent transcriptional response regulator [Deltaproteobacteria bacterium]|nr:sigma-54-dependent transcriptional response regulator [Deltaproteobacteria bacterium]
MKRIMVVDDEQVVREGVKRVLESSGEFLVETCSSGQLALERLLDEDFDLVITDLKMPGMSGMEVIQTLKSVYPDVPVVMITGYANVATAVEAMKYGAANYIPKPFKPQELIDNIRAALQTGRGRGEEASLKRELADCGGFGMFIGTSQEMCKVYRRIKQVAPTDSTVLVTGESGTGKELVARALHANSLRSDKPFVAVDCTSLVESLLESELFGHVKGSFTGAVQTKTGLFKVADGGTLFLDEISSMSLTTQAKLLRVLQQREVTPIGATTPIPVDIRLVAATNRPLRAMVQEGSFREDLLFRLNIIPIDLPPLRSRKGDLGLLVSHFLEKFAEELGKDIRGLAPDAMAELEQHPFPGNVRELENIIQRGVVLAEGNLILRSDLELLEQEHAPADDSQYIPHTVDELKETKRILRDKATEPLEKAFVIQALERNNWNITRAAEETGMQRPNFQTLMKKLNISSRSNFSS